MKKGIIIFGLPTGPASYNFFFSQLQWKPF